MSSAAVHFVHVDRCKQFTSPTLGSDALAGLKQAFLTRFWGLDRWANAVFRHAVRDLARDRGGLVLIGPGVPFDMPPPFTEKFEPIEVGRGLGDETDRLKTLSGENPTREERIGKTLAWLGGITGVALIAGLAVGFASGQRLAAMSGLLAGAGLVAFTIVIVVALSRRGGHWFLLPGGVAVIRRPARRGGPARITVLSRDDSCLALRYIHTGKTSVLVLELWTHAGGCFRRTVTQREAISIVAAWQSPHDPPPDDKLTELVNWEAK
ncbi:hypothetical protein RAS2_21300 [Phycisphaerae bacterium RAS2]|nr:hypothetical protein RAS2_21300 [Phycisphaerae bacterium RAS2]